MLEVLDERISVVSVPNVHWTDGAAIDLAAVADRSHAVGARLVIDGSQSVGAMPLDVAGCVPTSWWPWATSGCWAVRRRLPLRRRGAPRGRADRAELDQLRAGSQDFARLVDYRDDYQPGARRFDVGQRTKFELVPMAIAALEQLTAWGVADRRRAARRGHRDDRRAHEPELGLTPNPAAQRGPHLLGLASPRVRDRVLPALAEDDCYAALRGRSLRISPHLHVTDDDVDRLVRALTGSLA